MDKYNTFNLHDNIKAKRNQLFEIITIMNNSKKVDKDEIE